VYRGYLQETCEKKPQVNSPVPAGSECLKSHMGGGRDLCCKKHINPQIPTIKLPYKVIFTCVQVSVVSPGTCGHHPSQMGVLVSRIISSAGIICGGPNGAPMLCPNSIWPFMFWSYDVK